MLSTVIIRLTDTIRCTDFTILVACWIEPYSYMLARVCTQFILFLSPVRRAEKRQNVTKF